MALLEVKDVHTFYGNIEALKGISIEVEEGECVTLIGSNGAGKSTTLRSIRLTPRARARSGSGREITETGRRRSSQWESRTRRRAACLLAHERVREPDARAYLRRDESGIQDDLERFSPSSRASRARAQKGGTIRRRQQMLAIGRALMAQPTLLLWTNRPWGSRDPRRAHLETRRDQQAGTTILLVEQKRTSRSTSPSGLRPRDRLSDACRPVSALRRTRGPEGVPGA